MWDISTLVEGETLKQPLRLQVSAQPMIRTFGLSLPICISSGLNQQLGASTMETNSASYVLGFFRYLHANLDQTERSSFRTRYFLYSSRIP